MAVSSVDQKAAAKAAHLVALTVVRLDGPRAATTAAHSAAWSDVGSDDN